MGPTSGPFARRGTFKRATEGHLALALPLDRHIVNPVPGYTLRGYTMLSPLKETAS